MTTTALAPTRVRPATTIRIALEFVGAYIITRLLFAGGPGAFPGAGTALTGPGRPSELKIVPGTGYDGQFVYRLALGPFTRAVTGHGITLDSPAYRQQRIMTPLLGHIVSFLPGISVGTALVIVNTVAVIAAIVAGVELVQDLGRHPAWGAVLALPAALPASLALDLTEPVAWAGVLFGLLAIRRRRWAWMAIAFTMAVLARETAGVVVFGYAVESVVLAVRKDQYASRVPLKWLAVPVVAEAGWQGWLWHVWGTLPLTQSLANVKVGDGQHISTSRPTTGGSNIPFVGVIKTFLDGVATGDTSNVLRGTLYVGERIALVTVIATTGWFITKRLALPGMALVIAWAVATAVAFSVGWRVDVQFLRATMEAWGLSVLVLLHARSSVSTAVLRLAGITTAVVAVSFVATV